MDFFQRISRGVFLFGTTCTITNLVQRASLQTISFFFSLWKLSICATLVCGQGALDKPCHCQPSFLAPTQGPSIAAPVDQGFLLFQTLHRKIMNWSKSNLVSQSGQGMDYFVENISWLHKAQQILIFIFGSKRWHNSTLSS